MTDERSERLRQRIQRRKQRASDLEESTAGWGCGIGTCSYAGHTLEELISHQTHAHPPHTCKICHREIPEGFMAIYHVFEEHGRAAYVSAYDASPDDVRRREQVKAMIEEYIDVPASLMESRRGPRSTNP